MAAKKVSRTSTKKLKDKWRAKQWYTIHAPEIFDNKEIPSTPADDPSKINGRVIEVTMQELTGDFSKSYIKLKFRVSRVAGFDAYTTFVGHEFTSDYIRRLTRRRRTKVDGVFDVTTKDGYRIRVKPMAIAEYRIQSSQKTAIRHLMNNVVIDTAQKQRMGEFIHTMIGGDLSRDIFKACKPIYRLKRIDIRRSEILGQLSTHRAIEEEPEDYDAISEEEVAEGEDIDAVGEEEGIEGVDPEAAPGDTEEADEVVGVEAANKEVPDEPVTEIREPISAPEEIAPEMPTEEPDIPISAPEEIAPEMPPDEPEMPAEVPDTREMPPDEPEWPVDVPNSPEMPPEEPDEPEISVEEPVETPGPMSGAPENVTAPEAESTNETADADETPVSKGEEEPKKQGEEE